VAVTDQQIDAAVPPDGIPNRGLTNQVLKDIVDGGVVPPRTVTRATPASGETVTLDESGRDMTLLVDGSGPLSSLTVVFPATAGAIGQLVRIVALVQIDELTLNGGSFINAPEQMFQGDAFLFQKIEAGTWARTA
jgi:hypothetical protein